MNPMKHLDLDVPKKAHRLSCKNSKGGFKLSDICRLILQVVILALSTESHFWSILGYFCFFIWADFIGFTKKQNLHLGTHYVVIVVWYGISIFEIQKKEY